MYLKLKLTKKTTRTTSSISPKNITKTRGFLFSRGIDDVVLVSLLLTLLTNFTPFCSVSIVDFEQVNDSWTGMKYEQKYIMR